MAERLVFLRHAESALSARGVVNGDPSIDCPLTQRGREEAARIRDTLVRERFDLCVVTSFPRTQDTAEIVLAGSGVPTEIDPGLDDPPLGVFESKPEREYIEWLTANDWDARPQGGGESQLESIRRFVEAFDRLLSRDEKRILVIGHAFPTGVAKTIAYEPPPAVRPHYDCTIAYLEPIEIEPEALGRGVSRARSELAEIARRA